MRARQGGRGASPWRRERGRQARRDGSGSGAMNGGEAPEGERLRTGEFIPLVEG